MDLEACAYFFSDGAQHAHERVDAYTTRNEDDPP